jgi:hypothetical protein
MGGDTIVAGRDDVEPFSVIEEGETAAEREAVGEVNGSLRRLEETVEDIWNEYEAARGQNGTAAEEIQKKVNERWFARRVAS